MKKILCSLLTLAAALSVFGGYGGKIDLDKADGFYKSGETATCKVLLTKDGKPLKGVKARCLVKWESQLIDTKEFETTGKPVEFSYKSDKPGWVYFGFEVLGKNGKPLKGKGVFKHRMKPSIVIEIGAIFDVDKIISPVREPADFDEFWAKRVAEVHAAPLQPELTELDSGTKGIKLFAVKIPVVRGIMASGYLAYPENAKPKSLPAQIYFQSLTYSDVRRDSALNPAKSGAIGFAATWHGFPVGQSETYYKKTLRKYAQQGRLHFGDKEKWHCSDMFFRVLRELQFVKSLPMWDGKTLISHGGSLGGIQSAFATAIDKDVTLSVIGVPAFCECNAFEAGRMPYGDFRTKRDPATLDFGFYFDAVNFGRRITCEVYVCTGFTDETCRTSNVLAFYNAIPATTKKSLTTNPRTGHFGTTKEVKGNSRIAEIFRGTTISELPK